MKKRKGIPDEIKKKMVDEYRAGASGESLAEKYRLPKSMVYYWISKLGAARGKGNTGARGANPHASKDALVYLKHAKVHINTALRDGRLKEMDQAHLLTLLALQTLEDKT